MNMSAFYTYMMSDSLTEEWRRDGKKSFSLAAAELSLGRCHHHRLVLPFLVEGQTEKKMVM